MKLDEISNDLELELAKILCLYLKNENKDLIDWYVTGVRSTTPQIEDYISMLDNAITKYHSNQISF